MWVGATGCTCTTVHLVVNESFILLFDWATGWECLHNGKLFQLKNYNMYLNVFKSKREREREREREMCLGYRGDEIKGGKPLPPPPLLSKHTQNTAWVPERPQRPHATANFFILYKGNLRSQ